MILLDTHIWIWWVSGHERLSVRHRELIEHHTTGGLAVSMISCWEVAKKVEIGKLQFDRPVNEWLEQATTLDFVRIIDLTLPIVPDSTRLPAPFHRDPADQLIVATSRVLKLPLLTEDNRLVSYPHVETVG